MWNELLYILEIVYLAIDAALNGFELFQEVD
jgi:hypothetical protein